MEQEQIEYTVNIMNIDTKTGSPVRIAIPVDIAKYDNINELSRLCSLAATEQVKIWLTGSLPPTPENIQIERDQEDKLRNQL